MSTLSDTSQSVVVVDVSDTHTTNDVANMLRQFTNDSEDALFTTMVSKIIEHFTAMMLPNVPTRHVKAPELHKDYVADVSNVLQNRCRPSFRVFPHNSVAFLRHFTKRCCRQCFRHFTPKMSPTCSDNS